MFLNSSATTNPARKNLDLRRAVRQIASTAWASLATQTRGIRLGHISFVLGLALAAAAAVSLGAVESGTSPAGPQDPHQATHGISVAKFPAAPVYFLLVSSQDEADQLLAEAYHLQTEASGSVALPAMRVIGSIEDDIHFQDELSTMTYHGVDYRVTDARAK